MKRIAPLLKMVLLLAGLGCGRPAAAQVAISSNRYLFVVETAKAMKQQLPAAVKSVGELLGSGLDGQLRAGDTIGIWTYDSELRAGVFPMQVWSPSDGAAIAEAAGEYLGQQKPGGRARLAKVLPDMLRLLAESDALTVLLYSDGAEPIQGTPFDESINEVFKQHREELKRAHIPFVTVLVGRGGKLVKCTMNSAVGVNVPELPVPGEHTNPPPVKAAMPAPMMKASPMAVPMKTNPPLIVDYSKSNLLNTATNPVDNLPGPTPAKPPADTNATGKGETGSAPAGPTAVLLQPPAPPESAPPTNGISEPVPTNEPQSLVTTPPNQPPATNQPAPDIEADRPLPAAPVTRAVVPPPAPAVASPRRPVIGIWVTGAVAVLGVMLFLAKRRRPGTRSGPGGSLITKSFDQEKK